MTDFRNRLLALAGVAVAFAGMAYGDATCTSGASGILIRAEGKTEQVADVVLTCTAPTAQAAGSVNLTVFISPSLPITSLQMVNTGNGTRFTEAVAVVNGGISATQGVVTGGNLVFTAVPVPGVGAGGIFTITITNVRVDASGLAVGTGAPPSVSETVFVTPNTVGAVVPAVLGSAIVAFVQNGLTASSSTGVTNFAVCNAIGASGVAFSVRFGENFPTAFKNQGGTGTNGTLGAWAANNTETGYTTGFANLTAGVTNVAVSGTRVKIVFSNIPANLSIYVPLVLTTTAAGSNGSMALVTSETGPAVLATVTTDTSSPLNPPVVTVGTVSATGKLTVTNGSAVAVYEVVTQSTAVSTIESYQVPVYLGASAGAVAPQSAISASVSFAPVGGTLPNFVTGSSSNSVNYSGFNLCQTALLFPFITNQLGFDTGLAIANTSTDNLRTATSSNAAAQTGTCTLFFYTGLTSPAAPAPFTTGVIGVNTAAIPTIGSNWANTLSTIAPGFQGYAIANCNFLYAHGFAYIAYNLGTASGSAMGYIADVIQVNRLQGGATISSTVPEIGGR